MSQPQVLIVMGSDSDLPVMAAGAEVLESLGVAVEVQICSAHRTPEDLAALAKSASKRGFKVIIAGAGGAAHLPGVLASLTTLPVIGVPIMSSTLLGIDSLLSIVQMPSGVPVATVGINAAKNAGLLAARILALQDETIRANLAEYMNDMAQSVKTKNEELRKVGYRTWMEQNRKG